MLPNATSVCSSPLDKNGVISSHRLVVTSTVDQNPNSQATGHEGKPVSELLQRCPGDGYSQRQCHCSTLSSNARSNPVNELGGCPLGFRLKPTNRGSLKRTHTHTLERPNSEFWTSYASQTLTNKEQSRTQGSSFAFVNLESPKSCSFLEFRHVAAVFFQKGLLSWLVGWLVGRSVGWSNSSLLEKAHFRLPASPARLRESSSRLATVFFPLGFPLPAHQLTRKPDVRVGT